MTAHARARVSRLQRTEASRCERSDLILFGLGEHRVISLLAEPVRASDSYFPNQASVSHFPVSRIPFRNGRRDRFRSVHVARNVASRAPQNRPIDSSRVFGPERRHARAQDKRKRGGSTRRLLARLLLRRLSRAAFNFESDSSVSIQLSRNATLTMNV